MGVVGAYVGGSAPKKEEKKKETRVDVAQMWAAEGAVGVHFGAVFSQQRVRQGGARDDAPHRVAYE